MLVRDLRMVNKKGEGFGVAKWVGRDTNQETSNQNKRFWEQCLPLGGKGRTDERAIRWAGGEWARQGLPFEPRCESDIVTGARVVRTRSACRKNGKENCAAGQSGGKGVRRRSQSLRGGQGWTVVGLVASHGKQSGGFWAGAVNRDYKGVCHIFLFMVSLRHRKGSRKITESCGC